MFDPVVIYSVVMSLLAGIGGYLLWSRVEDEVQASREQAQTVAEGAAKYGLTPVARYAGYWARGNVKEIVKTWVRFIEMVNGKPSGLLDELKSTLAGMTTTLDGFKLIESVYVEAKSKFAETSTPAAAAVQTGRAAPAA